MSADIVPRFAGYGRVRSTSPWERRVGVKIPSAIPASVKNLSWEPSQMRPNAVLIPHPRWVASCCWDQPYVPMDPWQPSWWREARWWTFILIATITVIIERWRRATLAPFRHQNLLLRAALLAHRAMRRGPLYPKAWLKFTLDHVTSVVSSAGRNGDDIDMLHTRTSLSQKAQAVGWTYLQSPETRVAIASTSRLVLNALSFVRQSKTCCTCFLILFWSGDRQCSWCHLWLRSSKRQA